MSRRMTKAQYDSLMARRQQYIQQQRTLQQRHSNSAESNNITLTTEPSQPPPTVPSATPQPEPTPRQPVQTPTKSNHVPQPVPATPPSISNNIGDPSRSNLDMKNHFLNNNNKNKLATDMFKATDHYESFMKQQSAFIDNLNSKIQNLEKQLEMQHVRYEQKLKQSDDTNTKLNETICNLTEMTILFGVNKKETKTSQTNQTTMEEQEPAEQKPMQEQEQEEQELEPEPAKQEQESAEQDSEEESA